MQVRWTLRHLVGGIYVLTPPKTARSRRKIALTARALDALRKHRARQLEQHSTAGEAWHEEDFVFTNATGQALRGNHILQRNFAPLLARAGLPPLRFHDLRHTAATLLLLQGVHPKVVSEMLGHSTVSMTLDIYSHVLPDMQRDAVVAMERALQRPNTQRQNWNSEPR